MAEITKARAKVRPWTLDWLTLISAILIVFSFPPWNLYPLIWIALIPWFFALDRAIAARSPKRAFFQGVWLSFFMTLGGFYWVATVLHEFAVLPWAVAILLLLLLSLGGQLQFHAFSQVYYRLAPLRRAGGAWAALSFALIYTGIDWLLPKLFVDTLGHCLYLANHLRQLADIGAATILTFLIFLVNDALASVIRAVRQGSNGLRALRSTAPQLALVAIFVVAGWTYGFARLNQVQNLIAHAPRALQAAVIQPNIGDFDKLAAERGVNDAAQKVLDTLFKISDEALAQSDKPEVIIWPETSYPSTFRRPQSDSERFEDYEVENFVRERQVPVLFGGYDYQGRKYFNSFFFLSPWPRKALAGEGVSDLQVYHKNILLLFGEYIPGAEIFPFIANAFPQVGNFGRGPGPTALEIPTHDGQPDPVRAGPIICYEALFPNYVVGAARKGAQLLLNISNDSWFGPFGEPQLHLALASFSSIETRLPLLRSTNTGISTLVLPDGEITHATKINVPTVMNVKVPILAPIWTLTKAWGDWFGPFALLAGLFGCGWIFRRRR